ncbi:MAG TPA: TonB-dependent receptor [Nitrospiraceae bacterium]|nr:TonB-dependent receptor [Nitrospiraceae bacterium]
MQWVLLRTLSIGMCCLSLSCAVLASAEEPARDPAEEPIEVEDVIVSATKTPLPARQVTSAVEVITGEEMQRRKIKTVVDALRLAQGVVAFSNGGPGTLAQVRMRGANSAQTMVVLDGTIMNSPTDSAFDFANLTAENIERIEILRGAQSMLWGSDAIGGVINIITKRGTEKPTISSFLEYGSFATIREGAQASGAKGPIDFSMSVSRWDTSNFSAVDYRRGAAEKDGFHNWQASSKLGVTLPKDGRLEFSLRWWNSDVNLDSAFGNTAFDVFGSKQTSRNLTLSGKYEQPITSWWSQKLTLAQTDQRILFTSGTLQRELTTGIVSQPFPFPSDISIVNHRLEWQHNFQIAKPLLLTAGYQFRDGQGNAGSSFGIDQPKRGLTSNAGFTEAQVNIRERLFMTAGVRQDSYNVFGDATTYRVTAGYLIPEIGTKFRGSYATGFRAPSLNELFFQNFGNPNLRPEKSKSMDAGIEQSLFKDRLHINVGYFWNHFTDQIINVSSTTCPPDTFGFCPQNIQQSKSQGWEAGFQLALLKNLTLKGQYTNTLTKDLSTGFRLPRWPLHQASLIAGYQPIERLLMNVEYRYVGSRFNDTENTQRMSAFGVVNAQVTYDVTKQFQVYGRVDNLFNERYEEILFFGTPIRSVYGGIKVTL